MTNQYNHGPLYYLASPYSHKDKKVQKERAYRARRVAALLFKMGVFTFAPIPYNEPWEEFDLPGDWQTWEAFDKTYIERMDAVVVLTLDGHKESVGVNAEIEFANSIGIPVHFLEESDVLEGNLPDFLKKGI
jgi:hypothetical protein